MYAHQMQDEFSQFCDAAIERDQDFSVAQRHEMEHLVQEAMETEARGNGLWDETRCKSTQRMLMHGKLLMPKKAAEGERHRIGGMSRLLHRIGGMNPGEF